MVSAACVGEVSMTIRALLEFGMVAIPEASGVVERWTDKNFVGVYQAADNWCWAAAAATVATFYKKCSPVYAQCRIVDNDGKNEVQACTHLNRPDCGSFRDSSCFVLGRQANCRNPDQDKEGFLYRALDELGMLAGSVSLRSGRVRTGKRLDASPDAAPEPPLNRRMDIEAIDELLRAGHLICLRTRRRDSRHFIIVYGCETYPDYSLLIWDPAHGTDVIEADRFHLEHGPFTHKIITRAPQGTP
jgi:hypothetical protein